MKLTTAPQRNSYAEIKCGPVIFLDVLGAREFTTEKWQYFLNKRSNIINNTWGKIEKQFSDIFTTTSKHYGGIVEVPELITFADTIALCWNDQSQLDYFINIAGYWTGMIIAHALYQGIFLRGALACGEYLFENNTIHGFSLVSPSVAEAVTEESKHDWVSAVAAPSAGFVIDRLLSNNPNILSAFIKYD